MSTLILPSTLSLKPDRDIIEPGWDDRPDGRPRPARYGTPASTHRVAL
jgi:hypothetical protein